MSSVKVNNNSQSQKLAEAKQWYVRKNFSSAYIKKFQSVVGTNADGIVGKNTINSVISWQSKNNLVSDGKFGQSCAAKAGIAYNSSKPSNNASQSNANGISSQKRAEAKRWYDRKKFSSTYIKSFQKVVGTSADGIVGNNTIDSVISWQSKYGLESDGKFGQSCAAKAGIQYNERPANYASQNNAPTGKGINPKPRFQKQYDYKTLPYVEQRHYNEMKSAMGGTNFASWDINSSKFRAYIKELVQRMVMTLVLSHLQGAAQQVMQTSKVYPSPKRLSFRWKKIAVYITLVLRGGCSQIMAAQLRAKTRVLR